MSTYVDSDTKTATRVHLPLGFAAVTLLLACAGLFGMAQMNRSLDTYRQAVAIEGQSQQVEALLSNFRKQLQEWKNTLLRGKDEAERAKYWDAFQKTEAEVAADVKALHAALPSGEVATLVERFGAAHARMGADYRRGYQDFAAAGLDPAAGDVAVKGKDREPAELLVQAEHAMSALSEAAVAHADEVGRRASMVSYGLMLLGALAAVVAGVLVSRSITRPLGAAVEAARSVAGGDLRTAIRVDSDDETGQLLQTRAEPGHRPDQPGRDRDGWRDPAERGAGRAGRGGGAIAARADGGAEPGGRRVQGRGSSWGAAGRGAAQGAGRLILTARHCRGKMRRGAHRRDRPGVRRRCP